jgi:hypothetical protein
VLKCAVIAVTILLVGSLVALARGNFRLHGRINILFFVLTLAAVIGLEVLVQMSDRQLFDYLLAEPETRWRLQVHLCFSLPATAVMPVMLYTGLKGHRQVHLFLAGVFAVLWIGTFITGIFFLPPPLLGE